MTRTISWDEFESSASFKLCTSADGGVPASERYLSRAGILDQRPVSVALNVALRRTGQRIDFRLHDSFGANRQHRQDKTAVSLLRNQFDERHSLFGYSRLRVGL